MNSSTIKWQTLAKKKMDVNFIRPTDCTDRINNLPQSDIYPIICLIGHLNSWKLKGICFPFIYFTRNIQFTNYKKQNILFNKKEGKYIWSGIWIICIIPRPMRFQLNAGRWGNYSAGNPKWTKDRIKSHL